MEFIRCASAGTMDSSDAYVEIEPCEKGIQIDLESVVSKQFGDEIRTAVMDVLSQNAVKNARIRLIDRGALECVIRARVETAVIRGGKA